MALCSSQCKHWSHVHSPYFKVPLALNQPFSFCVGFISNDRCHCALYLRLVWFAKSVVSCPSQNRQSEACTYFLLPVIRTSNKGLLLREQTVQTVGFSSLTLLLLERKVLKTYRLNSWENVERAWPGGDWGYLVDRPFSLSASPGLIFFALGFSALYLTVVTGSSFGKRETTPGMCLQRLYHGLSPLTWYFSFSRHVLSVWPGLTWNSL